jgi:hypothetical protein
MCFNGLAYTPDSGHPHAVNLVNGADRYDYDLNGNLALRNKGVANQEQVLAWDAQNRLAAVTYTNLVPAGGGGGTSSTLPKRVFFPLIIHQTPVERYSYDADGGRVRKESKTEVTRVIGPHYEVVVAVASGQVLTTTKYYLDNVRLRTTQALLEDPVGVSSPGCALTHPGDDTDERSGR